MEPQGTQQHEPHLPPPSLWPVGFAVGIAVLLAGLIVGWHIVLLGAVLTIAFGFLWIRDAASGTPTTPHAAEPTPGPGIGAAPVTGGGPGEAALPVASDEEVATYPRSKFLEAATLGLGGLVGVPIMVPALAAVAGPALLPADVAPVDVGAVDDFPEGKWRIVTFIMDPEAGEVSRRTAFVRNNGNLGDVPSFTIVSNSCVHLGCPVQASGILEEDAAEEEKREGEVVVRRIPVTPASFGCPCHGGQYDTEGNRTAGPPVRALDRYEFSVKDGRLMLGKTYSVGHVEGEGKNAKIAKYRFAGPGEHVEGPSAYLYPIQAPH